MAGKLKGFDFKKLALDHGEKAVLGLVVLIVLYALYSTNWMPYEGEPDEITDKVRSARQVIAQNTWPDTEREQYALAADEQPEMVISKVQKRLSVEPYEWTSRFWKSLYDRKQPLREPNWDVVEDLIADPGRVVYAVKPDESLVSAETEKTEEAAEEPEVDIPDDLRLSRRRSGAGGSGMEGYDEEMASQAPDLYYDMSESEDGYGGDMGEYGMGMEGGGTGQEGEGLRFVSVRGVFPLMQQLRKISDATNSPLSQAGRLFDIVDFELQRQALQPNAEDPWGSEWETVDVEVAKDVLSRAASFDPDVVKATVTDSTITSPLPGLVLGVWGGKATHPRVDKFKLSESEIQQELEFNRKLLQSYLKQQQELGADAPIEKGGFADMQFGAREMQETMFDDFEYGESADYGSGGEYPGSYPAARGGYESRQSGGAGSQILDEILKELDPEAKDAKLRAWVVDRASAEGELLLFRYLDFDVEPGKTYRYRVRLTLRNPNFGRRPVEAGGAAHVVEGQTRQTDWSEPTDPVTVPDDVKYFIAGVKPQNQLLPVSTLNVFQWDPDVGTTINANLNVKVGQMVAGKQSTEVVDPAKMTFDSEEKEFQTGDVLVDALPPVRLDPSDHPDLQFPVGARGRIEATEQVLVSLADDQLTTLDRFSAIGELRREQTLLSKLQEQFEDLKNKPEMGEEGAEYGYGEGDEYFEQLYGGGSEFGEESSRRRGRRGRNVLRRGGS